MNRRRIDVGVTRAARYIDAFLRANDEGKVRGNPEWQKYLINNALRFLAAGSRENVLRIEEHDFDPKLSYPKGGDVETSMAAAKYINDLVISNEDPFHPWRIRTRLIKNALCAMAAAAPGQVLRIEEHNTDSKLKYPPHPIYRNPGDGDDGR
ncbi:MAG TPA: hypothetical protein VHY84_01690 [Bryobacteraceae bacterium]|nr:hypothetical protein [Bryobacteraceae bacterium]